MNGSEVWNITEKKCIRVQAKTIFIRAITDETRWDRITIEELKKGVGKRSLRLKVQKAKLRWFGHEYL